MTLEKLVIVANGSEKADLVLKNASVINVFSNEIYKADIAISGDSIAGVGPDYRGVIELDLAGKYVCPGFIDAHVHIESSMVPPREFAKVVIPHGVTTVIADPHEIANVIGLEGIRFMLQDAKHGPMSMFVDAPSCVPATNMETSGSQLEFSDLATLLSNPWVIGLGEVMNYPGVIHADKSVLQKIETFAGKPIDGHAPGVTGKEINAYVAAGVGSDHECVNYAEAIEKIRLGMTIFIREATGAKNLAGLIELFKPELIDRVCLCTDDRQPHDLIDRGSIDYIIRSAIEKGVEPMMAIKTGTINAANYFGLKDRGAIVPGRRADLIVFEDLYNLRPEKVYYGGRLAAEAGHMSDWDEVPTQHTKARGTINVRMDNLDFNVPAAGLGANGKMRVIGIVPEQLVTNHLLENPTMVGRSVVSDTSRDIIKIAVVERHFGTGKVGKGFIQGLKLKRGAIACTVAHDHHNIVVAGVDDTSMETAVKEIIRAQGGMVVVDGGKILSTLPLPIAGLMSDQPIKTVRQQYDTLIAAIRELGSDAKDPFMTLSFMALSVIPSLKLTDLGLVDVDKFRLTDLFLADSN